MRKYWEFSSIISLLLIISFIAQNNLGHLAKRRSLASLYRGVGGCNQHINHFLQPFKDLDGFTSKDLKQLKSLEGLDNNFLMRFHARIKAVRRQLELNNKELERLNALPEYRKNSAIQTRIKQLEIENDTILVEFQGEETFRKKMDEFEKLFNDYYN